MLNGSDVVKNPHDLVLMGLDLWMCTCTHLVKKETVRVKDVVVEAYVVYGMNVFEYEQVTQQRIHENQVDVAVLTQTHLYRNSRHLMRMCVFMDESILLTTMRTMSRSLR